MGGGFLLQFANRTGAQMMSYLVQTSNGKVIMIDSGHAEAEDARIICDTIKRLGGVVDCWIITHPHNDHFGGLLWLLENEQLDITVRALYYDFPPAEWVEQVETKEERLLVERFLLAVEKAGIQSELPPLEGKLVIDEGFSVEFLKARSQYEKYHIVNDASLVFILHFPCRSVLFLADLWIEGGRDLMRAVSSRRLQCDIVQMAHHGQNGVERAFYEIVRPKVCLYCAPDWLWDCDIGEGVGSGPWATLETRRWMDELGVELSCPSAYGDYVLY